MFFVFSIPAINNLTGGDVREGKLLGSYTRFHPYHLYPYGVDFGPAIFRSSFILQYGVHFILADILYAVSTVLWSFSTLTWKESTNSLYSVLILCIFCKCYKSMYSLLPGRIPESLLYLNYIQESLH